MDTTRNADVEAIEQVVAAVEHAQANELVRRRCSTRDGRPVGGEGTPMCVMSKEDGRWLLTACQNTQVLDA